jgi:hypothetical protein
LNNKHYSGRDAIKILSKPGLASKISIQTFDAQPAGPTAFLISAFGTISFSSQFRWSITFFLAKKDPSSAWYLRNSIQLILPLSS